MKNKKTTRESNKGQKTYGANHDSIPACIHPLTRVGTTNALRGREERRGRKGRGIRGLVEEDVNVIVGREEIVAVGRIGSNNQSDAGRQRSCCCCQRNGLTKPTIEGSHVESVGGRWQQLRDREECVEAGLQRGGSGPYTIG
jgi:hypothetical protein